MSGHDHEGCNCAEVTAALENLKDAIQRYATANEQNSVVVAEAVVVYETLRFGDEGETSRAISWTIPTEHWSLATAVGLLEMGQAYIKRDLVSVKVKSDDD